VATVAKPVVPAEKKADAAEAPAEDTLHVRI
jgi:hypothetical protein